jgi:cytochrome c-type biogenesis protein CcmH
MTRRLAIACALLALALAPAAVAAPQASLPDIEDEVMCAQCGTPLNASDSPVADDERAFIRERIAQGQTKEQIKAALVAEYGEEILALPDDDGFNLAAYLVPVLLALLAAAGLAVAARRWRRSPRTAPAEAGPDLDPDDARRLERDLAAYDS